MGLPAGGVGALDASTMPHTMFWAKTHKEKFDPWLLDLLDEMGSLSVEAILDAAAYEIRCDQQTARKYVKGMTSVRAPLENYLGEDGHTMVRFRSEPAAAGRN